MFDHIGFFVSDFETSIAFYEACLEPLGITVVQRQPDFNAAILGGEEMFPFIWIGGTPEDGDYHGTPLKRGSNRPMHLALKAPSELAVREFYSRGLASGGRCNGKPEDCGDGYFAAYLIDPDGNNIEAGIRQ
ncbi:MAG: VOC family protein [Verrucomicrobiota bacterium]